MRKNITFNEFCCEYCDGLYDPRFSDDEQSSGYYQLRELIVNGIDPASKEESHRWESDPTNDEKFSFPHIKYLRLLHPILRNFVRENWLFIKEISISETFPN